MEETFKELVECIKYFRGKVAELKGAEAERRREEQEEREARE